MIRISSNHMNFILTVNDNPPPPKRKKKKKKKER